MDKSFVIGVITIIVGLFTIAVGTDNVWNSPKFDIKVENIVNEETKPVDKILREIYEDRGNKNINAEWFRALDRDTVGNLKDRISPIDMWLLWNVYDKKDTDGLSQKLTIKNDGQSQAHDVIIQILGSRNFKMIEYTCPEIMSEEQITKEHGKKYVVSKSRMSEKLECEIIINSIGDSGIERVIVTADETHPRVWPDDLINDLRNQSIGWNILLYISIGVLSILVIYNISTIYEKRKAKAAS